jgi:hypothetical protein
VFTRCVPAFFQPGPFRHTNIERFGAKASRVPRPFRTLKRDGSGQIPSKSRCAVASRESVHELARGVTQSSESFSQTWLARRRSHGDRPRRCGTHASLFRAVRQKSPRFFIFLKIVDHTLVLLNVIAQVAREGCTQIFRNSLMKSSRNERWLRGWRTHNAPTSSRENAVSKLSHGEIAHNCRVLLPDVRHIICVCVQQLERFRVDLISFH